MLKVMIVDNESAVRKGLIHCVHWEPLGCVIAGQAEDGIRALEQMEAVLPDIIISDIRMPGMDGLELAKEIKSRYPHVKVIILTGFPDFAYAQRAISAQVVDFVLKPTKVEDLARAIEAAKAHIAKEKKGLLLEKELARQEEQNWMLQQSQFLSNLIRGADLSCLYVTNRMAQLKMRLDGYYLLCLDISPLQGGSPFSSVLHHEDGATLQGSAAPQGSAVPQGSAPRPAGSATPPMKGPGDLLRHLHQAQTVLASCLAGGSVSFVPFGDQFCYAVVAVALDYPIIKPCKETVDILNSMPQFFLAIGISSHCDGPLQMRQAAEEASQAAQFAKYFPEMPVFDIRQMPAIPRPVREQLFKGLRYLKSAIDNQNPSGAREILAELFSFFRKHKLPVDTVRNVCLCIHQFCVSALFLPDGEDYMSESSVPALMKRMDCACLDAWEENTRGFVEQTLRRSAQAQAEAAQAISSIKTYIAQHYSEDLSLETLAKQAYLSPSYLSRLFKRESGENISAYVQNYRIGVAKTLLKTTALKTYEIAGRVGIPDPVYFSRIFKKVTGVKPKDYRAL